MRDAASYSTSFPYGATTPPYSPQHAHRGDDRPCPSGTPVIISGTKIGATGATGNVTGAHLHVQEWQGDTANTRKPQNAFKPGVVTFVDLDGTSGDGSFGKYVTIKTADGWNDSYCHLSSISVKVGDVIGEPMVTAQDVRNLYPVFLGRAATDADVRVWDGKPWGDFMYGVAQSQEYNQRIVKLPAPPDLSHLDSMFQRFAGRNSTADEQKVWINKKPYTELIDVLKSQQAYKDRVHESEVGYSVVHGTYVPAGYEEVPFKVYKSKESK